MKRIIIWTQAKRLFIVFCEALKQLIKNYGIECETVYKFVNLQKYNLRDNDLIIVIGIQFFKIIPELKEFLNNKNVIIYGTEPYCCKKRLNDSKDFLNSNYKIWEYSKYNINMYQNNPKFVPFGYYSSYENNINNQKTIDILFYGDLTKRRKKIRDKLVKKGCKVVFSNKLYDKKKRDIYISKSKIVLDIFRDNNFTCNNFYRLSYLLANKAFIISEYNDEYKQLKDYIILANYDQIAEKCLEYLNKDNSLIIEKGYNYFKENFNMKNILNKEYIENLVKED